jgi:hypothetical protein
MTGKTTKQSGIRIYRAAEAPALLESGFLGTIEYTDNPAQREVSSMLGGASGADSRVLVRQAAAEGGFSLVYLFFKANYPLFRHRHDSDCLYLVLSGSAVMGNQTLRPGDSFFVPAQAPYTYTAGPDGVEILEVRHNVDSVTTTFTGEAAKRLEEAKETVGANRADWQATVAGPLLRANEAAG